MARVIKEETTLKDVVSGLETESSVLDRIWRYELVAGLALAAVGALVGLGFGNWWTLGLGGALFFLGVSHRTKSRDNVGDIGRFQGGSEGEKRVTKILQSGLPDSYLILNDVSVTAGTRRAQNDHVVLGPNGIFVIETKAYTGTLTGAPDDDYLEQTKEFRGKKSSSRIKNPIPQNEYHLAVVKERLAEGGFAVDDVVSLIVFTSQYVKVKIEGEAPAIVKPGNLCRRILDHRPRYSYEPDWLRKLAGFLCPEARLPSDGGSSNQQSTI